MTGPRGVSFEFDGYLIDGDKRLLIKADGESATLTPKVFDLLLYLVSHAGETVGKDELMSEIWPDTIVEENNLSQNISILRRTLGEKRGEHKFIATVPGRGYRFVAEVREIGARSNEGQEKNASDHFSPAVKSHLIRRPLVLASLAALAVAAGAIYYLIFFQTPQAAITAKTMAVLPFKPILAENRDEALEIGMADTLIARLGNSRDILVRPLGSVRRFNAMDQDPQAAGRVLGVDTVLDGNIQRSGEDVRINVRLIDVGSGASVWSGTYDEKFTSIFVLQDRIAGKVAEALKIRLQDDKKQHNGKAETKDPEAYRLYLQGRYYAGKITPPEVRKGIAFYQQAVDVDPAYASAYAGIADAYRSLPINSDVPSSDVMPKARSAAEKALEIDPDNADAHTALGWIAYWYDYNWNAAEREFKTALSLSPNNSDAHRGYSVMLTAVGRHQEAISEMTTARQIDPLSLVTSALEGQTYLFAGQYDKAIESINKTFELDPNFWVAHIQLSRVYIQQAKYDQAIAAAEKARQYSGGNSESKSLIGYAHAKAGRPQEARESIAVLKAMQSQGRVVDYNLAMVYNGLGETDEALSSLRNGVISRDVRLILLKVDRRWDNLRDDPRFQEVVRNVGLLQ